MIGRLLPHPVMSVVVALVWMLLVNSFSWGSLVFAILVGLVVPAATAAYWPHRATIRSPGRIVCYLVIVVWDIIKANIAVAQIILFTPNRALQPCWLVVPLELRSPEAIAVLAATITLTPGTVSCDLSEDGSALLVHCLHAPDPAGVLDEIKTRYEARLKEIFR